MKNLNKTITFSDAVRRNDPIAFSTMVKPVGSACNLDCVYCYYLDKADLYQGKEPQMSMELLEEYVRQYIEANDIPEVSFCWHGGEPLLLGIPYFKKALEFQKKYAGQKRIVNTLQTNGTLVNKEWCDFFRENDFLVGLSIDGPKDIHDAFRLNKGGQPTFDKVMRAAELMNTLGVEFNTLSVLNSLSEGRGLEVYNFLKSIGSHFMQFLPAVEYIKEGKDGKRPVIVKPHTEGSHLAPWSISSVGYGNFLNDVFDEWVLNDVGTYFVQIFDVALAQWVGAPPMLCSFSESCGDALVVEHNGDVYSCDHFVYPQYLLGNILEKDLRTIARSTEQFNFGLNKRNTLPSECLSCKYYFACRGECPKHRFALSGKDGLPKNVLCEGLKLFFSHIDPAMQFMTERLMQRQAPADVMYWMRQQIRNI